MYQPASHSGMRSVLSFVLVISIWVGLVTSQQETRIKQSVSPFDTVDDYFSTEIQADGEGTACGHQNVSVYSSGFGRKDYKKVLKLSWEFFKAQRSGEIPKDYSVSWRKSSHEDDPVPGGWYDAGDYLKLNYPLAYSVAMIAWGMAEFKNGYIDSGVYCSSKEALRHAVTYLMDCHVSANAYIGQIGHPGGFFGDGGSYRYIYISWFIFTDTKTFVMIQGLIIPIGEEHTSKRLLDQSLSGRKG